MLILFNWEINHKKNDLFNKLINKKNVQMNEHINLINLILNE